MRSLPLARIAWLAGALLTPTSALASPQDLFGHGARAQALGATGTASAQGADAVWANPALLSLGRQRSLTLGAQGGFTRLEATGGSAPGKLDTDAMRGVIIDALLPLPLDGVLRDRIALGLAFYAPTNVIVRGRVLYPEEPQFPLITDRAQSVTVMAGAGVDLGHGLRLGAGMAALAAITGTVLVATDASGSVGTKVDDQLVASYAPQVGLSYDLGDSYRVGVTYRGQLEARFAVRIEVNDLGSLTVPPLNIAGLAQFDPWQVQAEVARVRGPWRVALGVLFRRWSDYPGGPEPTVLCPPERPACLAPRPEPPDFKDTWSPRLGVERALVDAEGWGAAARVGYFLEPTPAPEQRGAGRLFDSTRHAFTLGGGIELRGSVPLSLDLFGQAHVLASRTHATPAGEIRASGYLVLGGATATVKF